MDSMKRALVSAFLKEFKKLAVASSVDVFVDRYAYKDAFIELGITKDMAFQDLLSLSVEDYCSGPEPDKDKPGSIWEFGKNIEGKEVYIKLKIAEIGAQKYAKCISFHKARFPQCYPLKVQKGG
jgi:hypothetical protein